MGMVKEHRYPLRLPKADQSALQAVVKQTGHSVSQVLVLSIRKGLPLALEALSAPAPRVTTVEPLTEAELERAYARSDEAEEVSAAALAAFQSQGRPD
jgi:hypothetical protein